MRRTHGAREAVGWSRRLAVIAWGLALVVVAAPGAGAASAGTHALVGGALGLAIDGGGAVAFVVGVLTHALLDMMPHHDPDPEDAADVLLFVGFNAATLLATVRLHRQSGGAPEVLWGAVGGALPDLEHLLFFRACGGFELCEKKLFPTHDGRLPHRGAAPPLLGYAAETSACLLAVAIAF